MDYCAECDAELEPDEPQTCYYTGGGSCGDCRDPRTGKPPMGKRCFHPVVCEVCDPEEGVARADLNAAVSIARRRGTIR